MDDLAGLDWTAGSSSKQTAKPTLAAQSAAFGSFSSYPSLQPTPSQQTSSGRSTPFSGHASQVPGSSGNNKGTASSYGSANTGKAQDSFSGLINFGNSSTKTTSLSLREQQELLNAEKLRKAEEQRRINQANYGSGLDSLARGTGLTPSPGASRTASPSLAPPSFGALPPRGTSPLGASGSGDDDLFAAFNKDTKVDKSSFFPPPATNYNSGKSTPANAPLDLTNPSAWGPSSTQTPPPTAPSNTLTGDNDDDPFGLDQFQAKHASVPAPAPVAALGDGDDFLGDLARPVEEVRREREAEERKMRAEQEARQRQQRRQRPQRQNHAPGKPIEGEDSESGSDMGGGRPAKTGNDDFDRAVEELVGFGFSAEDAARGLTESGKGINVPAAVSFLLDDAHRESKEKQLGGHGGAPGAGSRPTRGEGRSPVTGSSSNHAGGDDFAKTAAAMGTSLFKTANSLWKTSQKQLQKAVQDFQQDIGGDPSQPKWMRSAQEPVQAASADASARKGGVMATDEAMMLEGGGRPERRQGNSRVTPGDTRADRFRNDRQPPSQTQSPAAGVPRWQQSSSRLTKQAVEEESAQMYVSSARRRRPQVNASPASSAPSPPASAPFSEPKTPMANPDVEVDLLSSSTALPQRAAQHGEPQARSANAKPGVAARGPLPTSHRSPIVARSVPSVNAYVLQASAKHRADAAAHFKLGDYASAHASYSASLKDIPSSHPLLAVLYCNRALTALKTGEPRQAVADADAALDIIGSGRGEGESVDLEDGTGTKRDLRDMYGKAMTRKAEGLEQMEKWAEAGQVWQQCVENGVGGATAIAGRQRCQTAAKPKPASRPATKAASSSTPRPSASAVLSGAAGGTTPVSTTGRDFEAVQRLREANAATAREDSEKRDLTDIVDARVAAWRDGKRDNLRALLGSLDKVLWEGSGWKPVGLHELVMANKVKIIYMKAIAKTHPDKISQDASTEVRMIAGSVFSTLNESWDKFKADNKM